MADSISIDLWPDDISVDVVTPLAILRAQVEALQRKTKGLLRVDVSTVEHKKTSTVIHTMELIAPSLNNYHHQILSVIHSTDQVYPARLEAECFQPDEDVLRIMTEDWRPEADSEPAFVSLLKTVLKSKQVRSMIDSMLARINEATPPRSTDPEGQS